MAVAERRLRAPFARQRASTSPYPIPICSYPPMMYPSRRLSRSNARRVRHERRGSAVICGANIHFPRYPSAGRLHRYRDRLAVGLRHLGAREAPIHVLPGQRVEELDLLQLHLVLHRRLRESTLSRFKHDSPPARHANPEFATGERAFGECDASRRRVCARLDWDSPPSCLVCPSRPRLVVSRVFDGHVSTDPIQTITADVIF